MDWKTIAAQILPILKQGAEKLWDTDEGKVFLRTCAEDAAKLSVRQLGGEKDLEVELEIVRETVRQRSMQLAIQLEPATKETLLNVLGFVVQLARKILFPAL